MRVRTTTVKDAKEEFLLGAHIFDDRVRHTRARAHSRAAAKCALIPKTADLISRRVVVKRACAEGCYDPRNAFRVEDIAGRKRKRRRDPEAEGAAVKIRRWKARVLDADEGGEGKRRMSSSSVVFRVQ